MAAPPDVAPAHRAKNQISLGHTRLSAWRKRLVLRFPLISYILDI